MTYTVESYSKLHDETLKPIASRLHALLVRHFSGLPHVDQITVRAKSPESFAEKAMKLVDGKPKYDRPLSQLYDLIGARLVVFYLADVTPAVAQATQLAATVERLKRQPEQLTAFGYEGVHLCLAMPPDAIPRQISRGDAPKLFELQIKTLFQHAWSQAEHDLRYKGPPRLEDEEERMVAAAAAQAWGADRMFDEIFKRHGVPGTPNPQEF